MTAVQTPVQNDMSGVTIVLTALQEREAAKVTRDPEDNPFHKHTLLELAHGLMKGADNMPALNMAAKAPDSALAFDLESARFSTAKEGRADKSARRMAAAKQRADRRTEFDRIAAITVNPDPDRMSVAWAATVHLMPIIVNIAKGKQRWANRLLNGNASDIPSLAIETTALAIARQSKFDLDVMLTAAEQLGISRRAIPGNQEVREDDPKHVKQIRKARKWLMGLVNNRVLAAITDSYQSDENLRWDNIDLLATVMANVNGVGEDPITNRFKADRAPAFLGTRFPAPGGIDGNLLAMAVAGGITDRGLDPLVEYILDDTNRRSGDGKVHWQRCAEQVFLLTPGGYGQWLWDQVVAATANHSRPENARGIAAMEHVRHLFAFLPSLVVTIVDSFDPHFVAFSARTGYRSALLRSDFDDYRPEVQRHADGTERRFPLVPALTFGTVREAAAALSEYVACLTTGADFVRHLGA